MQEQINQEIKKARYIARSYLKSAPGPYSLYGCPHCFKMFHVKEGFKGIRACIDCKTKIEIVGEE
jgi:PHP family Zn ribbon phosphoesterase